MEEETKKKVALFRGAFNPVNNAHINLVKETLKTGLVDEIWIVPWMKYQFDFELTKSEVRIEMLEAAFEGMKNVKICREEIDFPGTTDQYNLLLRLKEKYDHEFIWLAGSDLLHNVRKWYKREEIFEMVNFIIFEREGFSLENEFPTMNIIKTISKNVSDISSRKIRLRREMGDPIGKFVPREVEKIIHDKYLYLEIKLP